MTIESPPPQRTDAEWQEIAAAMLTLTPSQLMAVAAIVTEETGRLLVRDASVTVLVKQGPEPRSKKASARWLHTRLDDPGTGRHADILRMVNRLSRGGRALSVDRIERILSKIEKTTVQPT